jgi:hypothetical protein
VETSLSTQMPSAALTIAALDSSGDELGQVLALLRAGGFEEPERIRVASGDRWLLELHRALTGRDLEVAASCSACDSVSMVVLSPRTVPAEAERMARLGPGRGLRGPTYGDLVDLPADAAEAERELVRRCTVGEPGQPALAEDLELVDDSLAGPVVLECVECGAAIEVAADAERLTLQGLQRYAAEVELEIHLLASAYGWTLHEIETLPEERRRRLARLVADGR